MYLFTFTEYTYVDEKLIVKPDITAINGVIHELDDFLFDVKVSNLLETIRGQAEVGYFLEVLNKADLIDDHLKGNRLVFKGAPFIFTYPIVT